MILLVTGGRDYEGDVEKALNYAHKKNPINLLVHGDARGADRRCRDWAISKGIHHAAVPALWDHYGNSAGPKRNRAMLWVMPNLCIAFPGGNGTAHMVHACDEANVPVWQPYWPEGGCRDKWPRGVKL